MLGGGLPRGHALSDQVLRTAVARAGTGGPAVRRPPWVGVAALVALLVVSVAAVRHLGRPPSRGWVEANLSGELLAYAVWDGTPHALVEIAGELMFDHLILDWISIEWPPTPRAQLSGNWYRGRSTDVRASLYIARCTGIMGESCAKVTELYGEINVPTIRWLEVTVDAGRRKSAISAPGFAVRLEGARARPTAIRWLDADGRAIAVS